MRYINKMAIVLAALSLIAGCGNDDDNDMAYPEININAGETVMGKDGAPMVLIPAGEFQMGDALDGMKNALPVHAVYLDAFYMDIYPVTNAQYKKFVQATGHREPEGDGFVNGVWQSGFRPWSDRNFNRDNQPVVCVNWNDAAAYAEWASKRLPTEAEWEKAARGGLVGKRYPWGNNLSHDNANYSGTGGKDVWNVPSPVGSFAPNGYGLYDMIGNVWEWCADWYVSNYYVNSPTPNPTGPESGSYKVSRGGSFGSSDIYYLSVATRYSNDPSLAGNGAGFRCAKNCPIAETATEKVW